MTYWGLVPGKCEPLFSTAINIANLVAGLMRFILSTFAPQVVVVFCKCLCVLIFLRFPGCTFPIGDKSHCLTADILVFCLLQSFYPLSQLFSKPWVQGIALQIYHLGWENALFVLGILISCGFLQQLLLQNEASLVVTCQSYTFLCVRQVLTISLDIILVFFQDP